MGKQKAMDKLWREFERAQAQFLTGDDEPESVPPERDDLAAYREAALGDVYDALSELGSIVPECDLDSDLCELCLGLRTMAASEIVGRCLERLAMLAEVDRVLG